jgi:hypothetical protein
MNNYIWNLASRVWLGRAYRWKPKCFGVYRKFMNCHDHPNCLQKWYCFHASFEKEKVKFD